MDTYDHVVAGVVWRELVGFEREGGAHMCTPTGGEGRRNP